MKDGESEFEVRFGVTTFFDVPKIEYRRILTGPKYIRTKLGPVHQGQTGPKDKKVRSKYFPVS